MSSKHPEPDLCQKNNSLEENFNDLVSVSCTISSIKSFRAKIQNDFSDSDCESFDDTDSKRSTNSNAGQIDEKTFETTLDSTSLKKSNIETVCSFVPICCEDSSKRNLELEQKFASLEKYMRESVTNIELIFSEKTIKLEAENNLMKEKIVSLEKSVSDLENQKIEHKSKVKSEIQDSNRIKQNPDISNCLGVFGLSTLYTTERELKDEFSRFGPLQKVRLVKNELTGCSKGYAFVYFESVEDAKAAKEAMCDQKINGRQIRVDFSITNKNNQEVSNSLGVFGLTPYTTEQELKDEFSRFGHLEKVKLVRNELTGCSKGYAFVYFESVQDAKAAKEAMCDQNFNGRQIGVDFSMPNKRNPEIANCLGVFGLTPYTTEQELKNEFSRFGPLEKVQLVRNESTGCTKGYAFVYYESVEDAKTAREAMNEQEFNGRHIRVNFSMTKMPHTRTPGVYRGKPTTVQLPSD